MNALIYLLFVTFFLYSLVIDSTFFKMYVGVVLVYTLATQVFIKKDKLHFRRKLNIASWDELADP